MSSDNGTVLTRDELTEALCVATWGGLTKSQLISKRPGSCKFHPKPNLVHCCMVWRILEMVLIS